MTIAPVSQNFAKGYVSDIPRDELPAGAAYRMKDWIPGLHSSRLPSRSGWAYTSPDLSTIIGTTTAVSAVAWAEFAGDEHLFIIGDDGNVYEDFNLDGVTAPKVASTVPWAVSNIVTHPPFWNNDIVGAGTPTGGLVILPARGGLPTNAVYRYAHRLRGLSVLDYDAAPLGGSPPTGACVGASWTDYLLLANGTVSGFPYPNRIWISGVGLPESWATGTDFWDSTISDIVALVPLHAGILVFGFGNTNLITGDTPPAGGNWAEERIWHGIGCFDVRSIAKYGDSVVFANNNGVYFGDGVTITDVTAKCGVKSRWTELVKDFNSATGWSASAGIYRNYYVISVLDHLNNVVTCHVFDLVNDVAFEFTNVQALMFAHLPLSGGTSALTGEERLFVACPSDRHVIGLHACWTVDGSKADADGVFVLPELETPFYKGPPGKKIFRSMRATYDLESQSGSTPVIDVDYCLTPAGTYVSAGSLPMTTGEDRERADLRVRSRGIGLRLTQAGESSVTKLGEIELDSRVLEASR